jgi:dimethylhistidine N-methyltransferase
VARFAEDIRHALSLTPRQVPSLYFYDALGSALFDAICELPWYRLTRAESALLERHGADILEDAKPLARIVELGAGSGAKLALLLTQRDSGARPLSLRLIDVSSAALDAAMRSLRQLPGVEVAGHHAAYELGLAAVAAEDAPDGRTLALFLGSNIGNFDPPAADALLRRIRSALVPGDRMLLGTDLVKPEPDLILAYADPLGVTAAFNLNVFARMNRELGATFDLTSLTHVAVWNAAASRVEMHVEASRTHEVHIPVAALTFTFEAGQRIWTESSYKYETSDVSRMLDRAGFDQSHQWIDAAAGYALTLAVAR